MFPEGMRSELFLLTKYPEIWGLTKSHLFLLLTISLISDPWFSFESFTGYFGEKLVEGALIQKWYQTE